ncbi:MAG: hypothetical protein M0P73_10145 [Syntrophobacterales bacterium]|jgi:hypothetical protein|nr:hypothetical protein [Syntrophobacterales bacterium]
MRFLKEGQADASADLVYRVCPLHLLEPAEFLKDMQERDYRLIELPRAADRVRPFSPVWPQTMAAMAGGAK